MKACFTRRVVHVKQANDGSLLLLLLQQLLIATGAGSVSKTCY